MLIKTLFKESEHGQYRAEIYKETNEDYFVECYGPSGSIKRMTYTNSSASMTENAASTWLNSIQVLNG